MIYCKDWSYCNEKECCPYLHWMTDQIITGQMKAQWYKKEKIIQKAENKSKEINAFQTFARKLEYQETVTCVDDDCGCVMKQQRAKGHRTAEKGVDQWWSASATVCMSVYPETGADQLMVVYCGSILAEWYMHGIQRGRLGGKREEKDKTFIFMFYILIPNILHSMFIFCFAEFITLT